MCVAKPVSVEDARKITENLLINRIIFLNLEDLDIETAQRIIDFIAGSCFAVSGNFQRVSNRIFLITPKNVDILGEIQEMMVLPLGISDG